MSIFYTGKAITNHIPKNVIDKKNNSKSWEYGYNQEYDVVVVSKNGTIGDIFLIEDIKIAIPKKPKNDEIENHNLPINKQVWKREDLPKGITDSTVNNREFQPYIDNQYQKRTHGHWIYIKGEPIWITPTYWYGLQWCRELDKYPNFRVIQNELMIFWEACKADQRCYGMNYVKNRRFGASFMAIFEFLDSGTRSQNKLLGIVSKKGRDAKKIFSRLVKTFKRLPPFFKPITDGTTNPQTELRFQEQNRKKRTNETIGEDDGLDTTISWNNTEMNALDGDAIFRSLLDECFAQGTKILMHDLSFKNIEDIKVGDVVIVEGGKKITVAKTMSGIDEMFLIKQPYSKDYVVNSKHRLYLEQRCKVKGINDDGVKIMTPNEFINLKKYRKRTTFGVRSKGLELLEQNLPIEPYMFGLWIGDGESNNARIIINHQKDPELVDYLIDYCDRNNFSINSYKTGITKSCKRYVIKRPENEQHLNGKWNSNKFIDSLRELDVLDNKHIPKIYLNNSRENRLKLLAGIIDTDGCLSNRNGCYQYELSSSKKNIADAYLFLCKSLGLKVTFKERKSNKNTINWFLYITGNVKEIPCLIDRKKVPKEYINKYNPHINKIDIQAIGTAKYYGIQLKANNDNDRRLILEDFTISMNCGKYPTEVPFDEYWYIVKTSHRVGSEIRGKSMCISTVNPLKKGGSNYKAIWDDSNPQKRNPNGQTKSGLHRIFIPAEYCLEGFFDQYGFSIVETPTDTTKNEYGQLRTIGASEFLDNEELSFKDDPKKFNEQRRQFPRNIADAFRDDASECPFNLVQIEEQIEYNEDVLEDKYYNDKKKEYLGNKDIERGNLIWEDGVQDSNVVWRPDPQNGKFFIKVGCHPPIHYRNLKIKKPFFGGFSYSPTANHIGTIGVDPYNRSKVVGSRGSLGSASVVTGNHTEDDLPRNTMLCEYLSRATTVELFFEDMIMLMVYYSMPVLIELSNDQFLSKIKQRGYRLYSMNNPFKLAKDLSPTEIEFGGAPQQDTKIADAQFFAVQTFVDKFIGYARNDEERETGKIGSFPFTRTLYQIKEVELDNRTKYDAYISFSLALLGNQKIRRIPVETNTQKLGNPFKKRNSYVRQ